jgi:hypothetical protein
MLGESNITENRSTIVYVISTIGYVINITIGYVIRNVNANTCVERKTVEKVIGYSARFMY